MEQEKATYAAGSEIGQLQVPIVHGYVDVLESGCVSGWAWVENEPSASVEIIVQYRQRTIAQGLAIDPRPDLVDAGVGTGRYGYSFSLPMIDLSDVSVMAKVGTTVVSLVIPERLVSTWSSAHNSTVGGTRVFEGHIDRLTRWGAVGWVGYRSTLMNYGS